MFGEYNLDQVVGGERGIWTMPTYAYLPDFIGAQKNWALEGQNMYYGETDLKDVLAESAPAIIDTGSSTLGVPGDMYDTLTQKWKDDIAHGGASLDCHTGDDFCQVAGSCESLASKVKPIGF
jgi:hypothetical protein